MIVLHNEREICNLSREEEGTWQYAIHFYDNFLLLGLETEEKILRQLQLDLPRMFAVVAGCRVRSVKELLFACKQISHYNARLFTQCVAALPIYILTNLFYPLVIGKSSRVHTMITDNNTYTYSFITHIFTETGQLIKRIFVYITCSNLKERAFHYSVY